MQIPDGRIEVHVHALPSFYIEAVQASGHKASVSAGFPPWTPQDALAFMERNGIAFSINSISPPGVAFGDDAKARAKARTLARRSNDYLALLAVQHPLRFG